MQCLLPSFIRLGLIRKLMDHPLHLLRCWHLARCSSAAEGIPLGTVVVPL